LRRDAQSTGGPAARSSLQDATMLFKRSTAQPAGWRLSFSTALRCAILLGVLFPVDVRGADEEQTEIPDPEELTLETADGVLLRATYYPGTYENKSVPIILLHGFKHDRSEFEELAKALQKQGNAVIAPDLRGHGESTDVRRPGSERIEKIAAASLRVADFEAMVKYDVETVKVFLRDKNNDGDLNIDKLCLVGAEMGAMVAANWAAFDWSAENAPQLSTGKQGQFVKSLVLISPEPNFKGLKLTAALADPAVRSQIAILMIAGKQSAKYRDEVNRLYTGLEKFHADAEKKDLERFLPDTRLQGTKLLSEQSLKVNDKILEFTGRLVKRNIPWSERKRPVR
jgi:pimeloyl-ACP methyl ester carboxylesterase